MNADLDFFEEAEHTLTLVIEAVCDVIRRV
jgi:hypothetical protein